MPLVRLELRNEYGLGDPELYRNSAAGRASSKAILNGVAFSGLVGILRQLGDLAEFGGEIFQDLIEQVMITSVRGKRMLSRVKKIEETLPFIEKAIYRKASYIDLAYENGTIWHADPRIMDTHLSSNNFPQFIMTSYDECRDPPRLYRLDKYDNAGAGTCLKRYSDPSYFKRASAASEPEKSQQTQRAKNLKKIKRKYSRQREGEVQVQISTASRLNRTSLPSKDGQSFSAKNSSMSEMRSNFDTISEQKHLNTMNEFSCNEHAPETFSDMVYDKLSHSNKQSDHDQFDISQLHTDELVFDVDDANHYYGGSQDSKPSIVKIESSEVVELPRAGCLNQEKPLLCIADMPGSSSSDQNICEEGIEADNYTNAHNKMLLETESDSECQTKCIQSLFMGLRKKVSETAEMDQCATNVPTALHDSSKNCTALSNLCLDGLRKLEDRLSTQETVLSPLLPNDTSKLFENSNLTISMENPFHRTDDRTPRSANINSEIFLASETAGSTSQIQISLPILPTPSKQLWTNGSILGLQPSKPLDTSFPNKTGECTQHDCLNNDVKSDEECMVNMQVSKTLNSFGKTQVSHESLSLSDQRFLNSEYVTEENSFMKRLAFHGYKDDGFCVQQSSQEQYEPRSLSESEVGQVKSPNTHQTTNCTMSEDSEENVDCSQTSKISAACGLLGKQTSSNSNNSQNSSPSLEHMKMAFHPMNSLNACNLKLELPDGINELMDENVFSSFHLFPDCIYPEQDIASESDDTFCKSYLYSTEDLLSHPSDSNSDFWEQDDCSESKADELLDDFLCCGSFEQMNILNHETGLKDIQLGCITKILDFESLINQDVSSEVLSGCPKNAAMLTLTDPPQLPPLPPMQWRLVKSSYDISEVNHSVMSLLDSHFDDPLNIKVPIHVEANSIIRRPSSLAEDGKCNEMKLEFILPTNRSSNSYEVDRKEQLIHQSKDLTSQCKLKSCQEPKKRQIANVKDVVEKKDFLHQIRTKTLNLRHTTASKPSFEPHFPTTDKVSAILQKAYAIRQACASSDEEDQDGDWTDD